ncbi:hypothetical protein VNO77_16029 [Canavalia gladiata]|uniref:Uncharacterized protein n=1 Tax=Canavalia gladiata TaxID=3824 RepID=A0AAN9QPK6_CANGL
MENVTLVFSSVTQKKTDPFKIIYMSSGLPDMMWIILIHLSDEVQTLKELLLHWKQKLKSESLFHATHYMTIKCNEGIVELIKMMIASLSFNLVTQMETIYANIGGLKYSSLNCCWRRIPSREKDDKSEIRNLVMKGTLLDWIISE